jgi:hypothetical protein
MLVEQFNAPGGTATTGLMSHWSGSQESPLMNDIVDRMAKSPSLPLETQALPEHDLKWSIAHECQKAVLFQMLKEAGVTVQLYTMVTDSITENNSVRGVITESKSGREAIRAQVTIDATGDGDVAARAGAEYSLGREGDHGCQPVTLMFRIGGVDYANAVFPPSFESYMNIPKGEIQALGKQHLPHPAGHVLLYRSRLPGEVCVNMTNVTGIDGTDVRQLTKAEFICREQIDAIIQFLREFVPGYQKCYLVAVAGCIGVFQFRHSFFGWTGSGQAWCAEGIQGKGHVYDPLSSLSSGETRWAAFIRAEYFRYAQGAFELSCDGYLHEHRARCWHCCGIGC